MHTVHISYVYIYIYHACALSLEQSCSKWNQTVTMDTHTLDINGLWKINIRLPKEKNRQNLETAGEQSRCLQDGRNPRHQQCPQDPTIKD